ncbi:MAG: Immunoglobulin I-set domain protein [Pedosphaera sp.]|nr:Immunoglobulin I-set domain protein [Pedosphaera sp.]
MRGITYFFIGLLVWLEAVAASCAVPYGLETRNPVGTFLNGKLPPSSIDDSGGWMTVAAFPNLTFEDPTFLTCAPGTDRLYVCGRQGMIWFFQNDFNATNKTVFLNLTGRNQGYDDCGLVGLAFHPEFGQPTSTNRGYFYVYYQYTPSPINPSPNRPSPTIPTFNRLSRFTVPDGSLIADPNSEQVLINQFDRNIWHNGCGLFFGTDGFLYLSNGDEGGGDDQYANSQKINKGLFSGVLRIDVNKDPAKSHPIRRQPLSGSAPPAGWPATYSANYYIPNDNPFVNTNGSVLEEFFAIGFRNPYRVTFDAPTGRIWAGDVGDSAREEVDMVIKGGNYQWNYGEGFSSGSGSKPTPIIGTEVPPIYDYPHADGNACIIGGYVYRGSQHAASLTGKYIFGDNASGRIWSLTYDGTNPPVVTFLCNMPPGSNYEGLSSFGVDQNNEVYLCQMGAAGQILKLARTGAAYAQPPTRLSQTGIFTNLSSLATDSGLIPYDVNSPLWSDNALKSRWLAVPNDGAPYTANEKIGFAATGEWTFPIGTVFVKHFELGVDETNPMIKKRLETRLLVRGTNGNYYGLTYKWRPDNSEADLLTNSLSENVVITTASGTRTQSWYYPSRQDCLICHNPNANYVLGVKTRQLNGNFTYPSTGTNDNQLRTLNQLGLFNPALDETVIPAYASLVKVTNATASLDTRMRSYLDANCAQCHRPNSGIRANFDARFDTPLESQGIINGTVFADLGIVDAKVITPGDASKSIMHFRMNTIGPGKMPPVARNTIDTDAITALEAWIDSLDQPVPDTPPVVVVQPLSIAVGQGTSANLLIVATGTKPLAYQWRRNGTPVSGATTSQYTLSSAQPADAGVYSIIVTNALGSITSSNAVLTVNVPPLIIAQPQSFTVRQGSSTSFSVVASSLIPLTYQWQFNGNDIVGASNSLLLLTNVQYTSAGMYSVMVGNAGGSTKSSDAVLSVVPAGVPSSVGLVSWWPGDGNANDIQGTNNGTLRNGTTFTTGKVGQAFNFNGLTNMVSVGSIVTSLTNTFTMQLWVNPSTSRATTAEATSGVTGLTGQRYAISPKHGGATYGTNHAGAGISIGINGVSIFEYSDNYMPSLLVYSNAVSGWTHVAVVYTNKQPKLYINGVLKRTGLTSTRTVHPSADLGGPTGYFSGAIDEVCIYNRALTAAEIQAVYNADSAGMYKGGEFTGINLLPARQIQLGLEGKTGGKFQIDFSTNLIFWSPLTVLTNINGTATFTDFSATNSRQRFYRSVLVP